MRVGSLFAGIGGLDLAVEWAFGASTVWQLDQVNAAVRRRHWPDALQVEADVQTVDPSSLPAIDILCGGFPCQDLSCAGSGAGLDGERSGLYREMLRFTRDLVPSWVVIENVPALLKYRPRLEEDWGRLGYGLTWAKARASDVGAPHRRARVFVIAERGGMGRGVMEAPRDRMRTPGGQPWPTPTCGDSSGSGARTSDSNNAHAGTSLTDALRPDRRVAGQPWPTPSACNPNEQEAAAQWLARQARQKRLGRGIGTPLGIAVAVAQPWATPLAADAEMVKQHGSSGGPSLHAQVTRAPRPWATPCSRDYKTGEISGRIGTPALSQMVTEYPRGEHGRRLRPEWVACLMGYPPGWTDDTGPRLVADPAPLWPRGWWGPAGSWWAGYDWEPTRTYPDHDNGGPRIVPGRPRRLKALGNAVCPPQALHAIQTARRPAQVGLFG